MRIVFYLRHNVSKLRIVYGCYSVSKLRIVCYLCHNVSKLRIVYWCHSVSNCLLFVMGVVMSVKFEFHHVDDMVSLSRDLHLVGVIVSVSCESLPLGVGTSVKYELRVVGS